MLSTACSSDACPRTGTQSKLLKNQGIILSIWSQLPRARQMPTAIQQMNLNTLNFIFFQQTGDNLVFIFLQKSDKNHINFYNFYRNTLFLFQLSYSISYFIITFSNQCKLVNTEILSGVELACKMSKKILDFISPDSKVAIEIFSQNLFYSLSGS